MCVASQIFFQFNVYTTRHTISSMNELEMFECVCVYLYNNKGDVINIVWAHSKTMNERFLYMSRAFGKCEGVVMCVACKVY